MNELSLFTGGGGGIWGSKLLGWRTICYVENDPFCQQIIQARIRDGYFDDAPIWDDVRTFNGYPWSESVDIITAGFPCQPFSVAGKQKAELDKRNMWSETIRIINEVKPKWCLLENVPGLLFASHGYFGTVLKDLAESGYNAEWGVLSASGIGAPHRRKRLWIVAHARCTDGKSWDTISNGNGKTIKEKIANESSISVGLSQIMANATGQGCNKGNKHQEGQVAGSSWWDTEPDVDRVVNGVADRKHRLKALGNGQVPGVVRKAWKLLSETR